MNKKLIDWWSYGGNRMNTISSLFDFWSDGTISGGQLLDKSGNGNHATVTNNLITLADTTLLDTAFYQSGGTAPSVNTVINTDAPTGDTHSLRFRWESVAAFYTHRTHSFVLLNGDSVTITFWAKKVTNSSVTWIVRMGNGSTNGVSSTLSSATYLISGSQAVGSWGQYQATFTNTQPGGLAHFLVNGGAGTHEVLLGRNITVTVNGESNNCFIMPQVAGLKTIDSLNHFYTSAGVSLTTRAAYQYNAYNKKIFCGGAFSYVFCNAEPTAEEYKIIANDFQDLDHAFDSCPIALTVGSGKTYATIQAAINVANSGDFRNRRRIEVYDNLSVSTYAGYTVVSGGGFMAYIQMNKFYDYITSVGGQKTITATKQNSLNDAQSGGTEVLAPVYQGGWRGIDIQKSNGGYIWHQDFAGMVNSHFIIKDCELVENGAQEIFDYRIANAQSLPASSMSFSAHAGGMHNGFIEKIENVTLRSIIPYTWQDVAVTSGNGGQCYQNRLTIESLPIYDPVSNPNSEVKESIRLTSSGVGNTKIFSANKTRNSTVNEVGAVKSIFLTEV